MGAISLVEEIMSTNPEVVAPDDLVGVAARKMRDAGVGEVLVVDGGQIIGALSARDIVVNLVAAGEDPVRTRVADVCDVDELKILSPKDPVAKAIDLLRGDGGRRMPVYDGDVLVGIVSLDDLVLGCQAESGAY